MTHKPHHAPALTIEKNGKGLKMKVYGARALYANVNSPRKDKAGNPEKYDCEFLVPKSASGVTEALAAIRAFGNEQFPGAKWKCPVISDPDREIEELRGLGQAVPEHMAMKAGHWVIKANAGLEYPPAVRGEIYSGCYACAVIAVAKYDVQDRQTGTRAIGVKGFLNGAQFDGDGQRLGGSGVNLAAEFGEMPAQSALPDNDFTAGLPGFSGEAKPSSEDSSLPF